MYMQKKVYVAPNFEVYNMEPESMVMLNGSVTEGTGGSTGSNDVNDMGTNKKQYGFNSAPWE